jgi:hypothetical protein
LRDQSFDEIRIDEECLAEGVANGQSFETAFRTVDSSW